MIAKCDVKLPNWGSHEKFATPRVGRKRVRISNTNYAKLLSVNTKV